MTEGPPQTGNVDLRDPSVGDPINHPAVAMFADLVRNLVQAISRRRSRALVKLRQYRRLERAAYALGFVCPDGVHDDSGQFDLLKRRPEQFAALDFPALRLFVHTLWCAERWNDGGALDGGFHVIEATQSGAVTALANHLDEIASSARR